MTANSDQIKPAPVADETSHTIAGLGGLGSDKTSHTSRSITAIVADLSKPLHPRWLKTKPASKKGGEITYIEWHCAVRFLDYHAPGWSYHVKSVALVGNLIAVVASISIPCLEGVVTREATGCEDVETTGYGDAVSNAEAMALKRAASKFGLALHLYQK
jgi:hypothetical protein